MPVVFILRGGVLFSLRNEELPAFRLQRRRATTQPGQVASASAFQPGHVSTASAVQVSKVQKPSSSAVSASSSFEVCVPSVSLSTRSIA